MQFESEEIRIFTELSHSIEQNPDCEAWESYPGNMDTMKLVHAMIDATYDTISFEIVDDSLYQAGFFYLKATRNWKKREHCTFVASENAT